MLDATTSLGDLVTAHPSLARELERRGLDYCCGGRRSLSEACAAAGLDADVVVGELTGALVEEDRPEWLSYDAAALVDHIEATHHRFLWDELPRITALVDKITDVHGERHPELPLVRECVAAIRADLEPHMLKEERVLFPLIRELVAPSGTSAPPSFGCGSVRSPIAVMLREHDAVGDLLVRLRDLTHGYEVPADGCASYRACFAGLEGLERDTHLHIHKENNVLFPMVEALDDELTSAVGG